MHVFILYWLCIVAYGNPLTPELSLVSSQKLQSLNTHFLHEKG
jgi:hypothetical protein